MHRTILVLSIAILTSAPVHGETAGPFIAGVAPYQRPAGAPVITEYHKDAAWFAQALHGIEPPFPYSLRFLESQGAWFTPFRRPGMTGPYDIRNWH